MSTVGQRERATQDRVVKLLNKQLGYQHLGKWAERPDNSNIEEVALRSFLKRQGYSKTLIDKALYELNKVAGDQTRSLYDINKAVYSLLRYGVPVKPDAGENTETVWLIDWKTPLNNDFALAEEVTVKGEHSRHTGTEALDRLGEQCHSPESGQPGGGFYPALLRDGTVDHGRQR